MGVVLVRHAALAIVLATSAVAMASWQATADEPTNELACPDDYRLVTQFTYADEGADAVGRVAESDDADAAAAAALDLVDSPVLPDELTHSVAEVSFIEGGDPSILTLSAGADVLAIVQLETSANGGFQPVLVEACK